MSISYSGYCDICEKQVAPHELHVMLGLKTDGHGNQKSVRLHVCETCEKKLNVRNGIVDMTSTLRTATPKD